MSPLGAATPPGFAAAAARGGGDGGAEAAAAGSGVQVGVGIGGGVSLSMEARHALLSSTYEYVLGHGLRELVKDVDRAVSRCTFRYVHSLSGVHVVCALLCPIFFFVSENAVRCFFVCVVLLV